jgi:hypothetical protein
VFLIELTASAPIAASSTVDDVPANLRLAIAQQVATLPKPARVALRRMAALGRAVPFHRLLDRLVGAGQPPDSVVDALEPSCRYGILDETRTGYRFPLIHELLVAGLGPTAAASGPHGSVDGSAPSQPIGRIISTSVRRQ